MKKEQSGIPHLEEQIAYLDNVKDEDIDFSDIPEIRDLSGAVQGKFYRPSEFSQIAVSLKENEN